MRILCYFDLLPMRLQMLHARTKEILNVAKPNRQDAGTAGPTGTFKLAQSEHQR